MSVIDLTQDDIDDEISDDSQIEIVNENVAPPPTYFNNTVSQQCLAGQMRASVIVSETSPYYQHGTSIQVPMVLHNRAGQFELPHVDLYDTRGVLIGTLEESVARTIHSLLVDGHIRVVGFNDGILRGRRIATVLLSFYADRVLVEGVTGILRNSGLLVAPLPRPGGELHDFNARPQQTQTLTRLTDITTGHGPRQPAQAATTSYNTDAIRNMLPRNMTATATTTVASTSQNPQATAGGDPNSRLAAVKETFVTQIDLPEAEQPDRVITTLKRHQRQALFFMTLRETRDADIAKPRGAAEQAILPSLWITDRDNIQYHHTLVNLMCASKPPPIKGGILADDMGLGKTLSVLSLILKVPPPERNRNQREDANGMLCSRSHPRLAGKIHGSNLIICPLSTMSNWQEQVEAHIEPDSLTVCAYHGSNRKQNPHYLASYDIVLTTYSTMASEFTKQQRESLTNTYMSPLQEVSWHRVVLDEAHSIKERRTAANKAARELRAERRWCLTGTPIQNRLDDLYSLLLFMHAKPMDDLPIWNRHFASPFESYLKTLEGSSNFDKRQENGAKRVQQLMQCLCLRRMKQQTDVKTNAMLVELPPKFESMRRLELSPRERELYDKVEGMMRDKYKSMSRAGTVLTQYMHVWTLILRLRQLATHPRLWSEIKQIDMQALFEDEDSIEEQQWQQQAEESRRGRRGRGEVVVEEQEIETNVEKLSLWSNEAELFGQNIKCAYCEDDAVKEEDMHLAQTLRPEDFPGPAVTACHHIICRRCQQRLFGAVPTTRQEEQDAIMNDTSPVTECPLCDDLLGLSDLTRIPLSVLGKSIGGVSSNKSIEEQPQAQMQVQEPEPEPDPVQVPEQDEEQGLSVGGMYSELGALCRQFTTSTKTSALMRDIDAIREKRWHLEPGFGVDPDSEVIQARIAHLQRHPSKREKSLVFSQWTTMLDLISPILDDRGIQYTRLDGTLSRDRRMEVMKEFRNNPEMEIMLVSLRAGGVGLNLSCANHVFLTDSFWNPSVEQQAVDRVYRLGQKHPVTVTRYFIENSVEERILKLQRHKTRIVNLSLRDKTRAKHLEEEEEDPLESALAADEDHIVVPTSTNSRQRRLLDLDAILG